MPDPSEASPPPDRPARSSRRNRFVLPADHHDERVGERIEAFLEGPQRTTRAGARAARPPGVIRVRTTIPMDTRADWDQALRQEDARTLRYGRPASVMVAVMRLPPDEDRDRCASRVGKAIRFEARETDRVARVGPHRFHVLLPETLEADATALAERVRLACLAPSSGKHRGPRGPDVGRRPDARSDVARCAADRIEPPGERRSGRPRSRRGGVDQDAQVRAPGRRTTRCGGAKPG